MGEARHVEPRSVLVVDDHPIWRDALQGLLESEGTFEVTAQAASLNEARAVLANSTFDLITLDMSLPDGRGLDLVPEILEAMADTPIVFITAEASTRTAIAALDAGAQGYLPKTIDSRKLNELLMQVISGGLALEGQLAVDVLTQRAKPRENRDLSERESEVLNLMCAGVTSTEALCERMFLSERTVKGYLSSIFTKLGVTDRTAAVALAFRERLVSPDDPELIQ